MRVVLDLVISSGEGLGNLAFDNWYSSTKLISALTAMKIPTISTVRSDRVGDAPFVPDNQMKKKERGEHFHLFDKNI